MKIRGSYNNNRERYAGTIYEHMKKIIVIKYDTLNHYDASTDEQYIFNSVSELEEWEKNQDWIVPKKTKKMKFKKVKQ